MSVNWTKEQQAVIRMRHKNLLVSAAAGSGKTAVLVERILSLITDPDNPVNLDELLVVTFTRAAAGEMKERIGAALEKRLEEDPGNVHLQQQAALLHHAQISTIHGFCTHVIQTYYQRINLDPGYRIGDENELSMMKREVLGDVIEEKYAEKRPEFQNFSEAFASGKTDSGLEELVLQVYEKAVSEPWPEEWLKQCLEMTRAVTADQLEQAPWMQAVLAEAGHIRDGIRQMHEQNLRDIRLPEAPSCYEENIAYDAQVVNALLTCRTYAEYRDMLAEWEKKKLSSCRLQKGEDASLKEQIKNRHNGIWDQISALKTRYFSRTEQALLQEMREAEPCMQVLVQLVLDFRKAFGEEKRKRNLCDFSDLEHYALQILMERDESGALHRTDAARELSRHYAAVMIDEYQDSNYIQEALLSAVSGTEDGRNNRFMVGDIKQSIYGFRQARPDLFQEKYRSYGPPAQESPDHRQDSVRIDLFQNFRSRSGVLDTVNALFRKLMTAEFGGIVYDDAAALHFGASYYPDAPDPKSDRSELLLLDQSSMALQEDHGRDARIRAEARLAAGRIRQIQREGSVWDKDTGEFRRPRWSDFAVLLRTVSGWADTFVRVLNDEGIPAYSLSREGYFSATEVVLTLDYLRILDNPRQEIPFAAVLRSPMAGLTDRELALLKTACPDSPVYEAAEQVSQDVLSLPASQNPGQPDLSGSGEEWNILREKLQTFFGVYRELREKVPFTDVQDLVRLVLDATGFGDYAAAMPAGEQRKANLDMLVEKAAAFGKTGNHSLFSFIRYIERMNRYQIDEGEVNLYAENEDIVRVMTIHKSKGLEFPIVFVCGLGKSFNLSDQKGNVLVNSRLGIGLELFDLDTRVKQSTLQRSAVALKNSLESRAEELRVLYVALTRAKEKLIMTGVIPDAARLPEPSDHMLYTDLAGAKNDLDWILPARPSDPDILDTRIISFSDLEEEEKKAAEQMEKKLPEKKEEVPEETQEEQRVLRCLDEISAFSYPCRRAAGLPAKLSVSEIKDAGAGLTQEEGETELYPEEIVTPYVPVFMCGRNPEENASGSARGIIWHHFLQTLDFQPVAVAQAREGVLRDAVRGEKQRMIRDGILREEEAAVIGENDAVRFLTSDLGRRMTRAAMGNRLFRERPFVLDVPADVIDPAWPPEENILVQGTIDAYFQEDGAYVLVDYKTDRVRTGDGHDLVEKYQAQLSFYRRALEKITGIPVKESWLYSFALGRKIGV